MPRPDLDPQKKFEISEEKNTVGPGLMAIPLTLRKQALQQFDFEFRLEEKKANEQRFEFESKKNPELVEAFINAKNLLLKGEAQLAYGLYSSILKTDSQNELAVRGLAESAKALFRHDEALSILKILIEQHKTSENYKLLADQLYAMSYFEDAIEFYMRSLQAQDLDPQNLFNVYKNIGNIFLRLSDPDSAEEFYNKAYTLDPESDVLFVNYGSLYVYKGDYNKALERFREAVQLNDKNDKAWVGLAMIHREYGDLELSWANVEKALDLEPANESAIKLVADWAMKDNEIEKAIARLGCYLKFNNQDAVITMWFAKFLYFSERLEEAKIKIEHALKLNPNLDGASDVFSVIQAEISDRKVK